MLNWNEWVDDVYTAVDDRDVDGFVRHLASDAWVRVGNAEPVTGIEAIRAAFSEYFSSIAGLKHEITGRWCREETIVLETDVSYTRLDGSVIILPAATIYRVAGVQATRCQIFMDISPLFAGQQTPALCRAGARQSITTYQVGTGDVAGTPAPQS